MRDQKVKAIFCRGIPEFRRCSHLITERNRKHDIRPTRHLSGFKLGLACGLATSSFVQPASPRYGLDRPARNALAKLGKCLSYLRGSLARASNHMHPMCTTFPAFFRTFRTYGQRPAIYFPSSCRNSRKYGKPRGIRGNTSIYRAANVCRESIIGNYAAVERTSARLMQF